MIINKIYHKSHNTQKSHISKIISNPNQILFLNIYNIIMR